MGAFLGEATCLLTLIVAQHNPAKRSHRHCIHGDTLSHEPISLVLLYLDGLICRSVRRQAFEGRKMATYVVLAHFTERDIMNVRKCVR